MHTETWTALELTPNGGLFLVFHIALENTPPSVALEKEKGTPARVSGDGQNLEVFIRVKIPVMDGAFQSQGRPRI